MLSDFNLPKAGSFLPEFKYSDILWKQQTKHAVKFVYSNDSKGAYLYGNGIFERNHNSDKNDNRGNGSSEENALNLMMFYKKILSYLFYFSVRIFWRKHFNYIK